MNVNEEELKELFSKYRERIEFVKKIGLKERATNEIMISDFGVIKQQAIDDIKFITSSKILTYYIHIDMMFKDILYSTYCNPCHCMLIVFDV